MRIGRIVVGIAALANTRFALAVHALTLLGDAAPSRVSSEEMSLSIRANPVHIRRVLGRLREAGLVASRPGASGGWALAVDPATTTLADIWRVVHGDEPLLAIHGADPECPVGRTIRGALVELDQRAADAVLGELATTTLADLVGSAAAVS